MGQCLVRSDRYLERENGTEAGEGQQGEGGNRGYGSQGITPDTETPGRSGAVALERLPQVVQLAS